MSDVYPVPADWAKKAFVTATGYEDAYAQSIRDPDTFWREEAKGRRIMAGVDHGGGIDAATLRWGGARADWLDLSTGINPCPPELPEIPMRAWHRSKPACRNCRKCRSVNATASPPCWVSARTNSALT